MKKALFSVFALLFMCGCGSSGGGGIAPSSGGGGGGSTPTTTGSGTGPQGVVTINIIDGDKTSAAKSSAHQLAAVQPPVNTARVIFRNISSVTTQVPNLDADGNPDGTFTTVTQLTELYERVVDAAFSAAQTSVQVGGPASPLRGYVFDVLTYNDDGASNYTMSKYGRSSSNIVISPTQASGGSVVINAITPAVTVNPSTLISESRYNISVTSGRPLRNLYKMRQDVTDITFASFANYSSKQQSSAFGTRSLVAPTTYSTGTLYLPIQVFIDESMLGGNKAESYPHWSMIYNASAPIIGLVLVGIPVGP